MNYLNPLEQSQTSPLASPGTRKPTDQVYNGHHSSFKSSRKPGATAAHRKLACGPAARKCFVLDTNVLLHDPTCFQRFADNHVCIPVDALSELDGFKNEQSDRGANARAVHRTLTQFFDGKEKSVTDGAATPGGGTVRLLLYELPGGTRIPGWVSRFRRTLPDQQRVDHRIIASTLMLQKQSSLPVILVTKDLNLQLKARAVGIACEDYLNDKVEAADVNSYETHHFEVTANELQRFASTGALELERERVRELLINQYVLLTDGPKRTMPARFRPEGRFRRLLFPKALAIPGGGGIRPVNLGQQCFLDALLDPDISLVTCYGRAGTGKTLLAVAAGLHAVCTGAFRGLTVSRPVIAMGDTLGYLPGTLDEKMRPWVQPIYDALDFLMPPESPFSGDSGSRKNSNKKKPGAPSCPRVSTSAGRFAKPYEGLIEKGVIEIEALCYIRGRSIPHRFFVLDEAQQLTPLEAKTVVTRMSRSSKLILVGDPGQIDNPYVDSRSNGLVYTRDRLKGQGISAHISLNKGERSDLAELGATLM